MPLSKPEIKRFRDLRHHDPHAILGFHPEAGGKEVTVRAYRPDATDVHLLQDGKAPLRMSRTEGDLFEISLPTAEIKKGYQIQAVYVGGVEYKAQDPYQFSPSLGDVDLHLMAEGKHWRLWERLGARLMRHEGIDGVAFAVWAPGAGGVSLVGEFNNWDGRLHPMRSLGGTGIWELFVPGLKEGQLYKFEIRPPQGTHLLKSDPLARSAEVPPGTASRITQTHYQFQDQEWMQKRAANDSLHSPMSIYELHLGSWRRRPEEGNRSLSYRELAEILPDYVQGLGFTHVELMPIMEHPFGPSWGYQVGNYFAPTARYGEPDDFRYFVDALHQAGIGVILDWVPAHFPKDAHALGRFTGEAIYEHHDSRQGEHPDWGTFIFNFGRNEVRNFLIANALYWLKEFHLDGLRIDAVASMLYLDYSRKEGEWVPNRYGGRENIEAIDFIKQLNAECYAQNPGCLMIAEESTAWGGVSRPTFLGGLGFGYKWNMGWMHDTLEYFCKDPIHRKYHHYNLTFGFLYAWSENFILPLSHDEVVHGKGALLSKMPGDRWQKFANLRSLYSYMWAHPGKKLLFMGAEIGQWREWQHDESLDWHVLLGEEHAGLQKLISDLNRIYKETPALWDEDDSPHGFTWIDGGNSSDNILTFYRQTRRPGDPRLVCLANFSPVPREHFRVGLPGPGLWKEVFNSDASRYAGSNMGNQGGVHAEAVSWNGQSHSAELTFPPMSVVWLLEAGK